MSSFSEFFGRKTTVVAATANPIPATEKVPPISPGKGPDGDDRPAESWAEMGTRIGGDNEVLRNLLVDTGRRIGALDDLKDAFGKLVDPINKTLRVLEQEKSENVSLRGTLTDLRATHDTLRAEFADLGKRSSHHETEIERLRHELEQARQHGRNVEVARSEVADELMSVRSRIGELEHLLTVETNNVRGLSDEKHAIADHSALADKRIVELEAETTHARERLVLLENEKRSLQGSLESLVAENSRLSRKLSETENSLTGARSRIEQIETALAASEQQCNKLTGAIDEANERRQSEGNSLNLRLEAMQSRATAAEKLLGEVRQSLIARTEENRQSERKVVEATVARNSTEKKLEQLLGSLQTQERQVKDLESSRATLVERTNTLLKTVKARETSLARAEERVQALNERVEQLENESESNRLKADKRIEELNAALQREKLERAVTEGALEATRKNYAELQRELAAERGGRRDETTAPALVADNTDADKAKAAKGKPTNIEPIITP